MRVYRFLFGFFIRKGNTSHYDDIVIVAKDIKDAKEKARDKIVKLNLKPRKKDEREFKAYDNPNHICYYPPGSYLHYGTKISYVAANLKKIGSFGTWVPIWEKQEFGGKSL